MHRSRIGLVLIDHPGSSYEDAVGFWAGVQGVEAQPEEDGPYAAIGEMGSLRLEAQRIDVGEPRVHLDIETDDVAAETDRVVALGASLLEQRKGYSILRDPGGLVFCVVPVQTGEKFEAEALSWP
jgi:Glyoxalase-like domain